MATKKEFEAYQIKCAEAESALEACSAAFELIPLWALERGQTWIPSEVALHLLKKAKDDVTNYGLAHWHNGSGI